MTFISTVSIGFSIWFSIDVLLIFDWCSFDVHFIFSIELREHFWIDHSFFMIFLQKFFTTRNKLARAARKSFEYFIDFSSLYKKFLTNWRAQRGKFLTISLIFHDFSQETLCVDKIISQPRGILCVDKIGSPHRRILYVDKIGSPGKPSSPCWGYNIKEH